MRLTKALKLKNRLAGEVSRLQQILVRENTRRNDSKSTVDQAKVFEQLGCTRKKLVQLKTAIAKANVGIYERIALMEEFKGYITYLSTLPVRDGEEVQLFGRNQEKMVYTWESYLKREDIDKLTKETQDKINECQDAIDSYNSQTDVDFEE